MSQFTNAQILSAVLNRFIQPVIVQFAHSRMQSLPAVQMIENKVRSWGIVNPSWSLTSEIAPLVEPLSGKIVEPMLRTYISKIPDESIPEMAHQFVDSAIAQGGLNLLDGRLQIELSDLQELKKLLNYNLPYTPQPQYEVKTQQDNGTADTANQQPAQ